MNFDSKVFWRYIYHEHLNLKRFLKSSVFYEYLLIFILFYSVFFVKTSLANKVILTVCFLLGYSFLKFWALYKSGYHRRWHRLRTGMLTKSELRKKREEFKKEKNGR